MNISEPLPIIKHLKTDWLSVFGLLAIVLLLYIVVHLTNNAEALLSLQSFAVVVGGTFFIIIFSASKKEIVSFPNHVAQVFLRHEYNIQEVSISYLEYAALCYNNSNKDLLKKAKAMDGPILLQHLIRDIEDNIALDDVLSNAKRNQQVSFSHYNAITLLCQKIVDVAPAMGLIGTIIGLVQLLSQLEDPASLGPAMALALLTTLYGAMLANIVFLPITIKLDKLNNDEYLLAELSILTAQSIASRENPRKLETRINSLLPAGETVTVFQ